MRYLKSILFISLLSICAVQANANILTTTVVEKVMPPKHIIEVIDQGKVILISSAIDDNIVVFLTNSEGQTIYENTLTSYNTIKLSNLPSGVYKLSAFVITTGDGVSKTIIIK